MVDPSVRTWTSPSNVSVIDGLIVNVPCRMFVFYDASLPTLVRVDAFSNSDYVVDLIQSKIATRSDGSQYVKVFIHIPQGTDSQGYGSILTRVTVNRPFKWISTESDVVLGDGTVVNTANDSLTIRSSESAQLFYHSETPLALKDLDLQGTDAATIQVIAPSIQVYERIVLKAIDEGSIALISDNSIVTNTLKGDVNDNGSIYMTATQRISSQGILLAADDCGRINIYPHGDCNHSSIRASDTGQVNVGSIGCKNVDVKVDDSSVIVVQAVETLSSHVDDSGLVLCYNTTPAVLVPPPHGNQNIVATNRNTFKTYNIINLPTYEFQSIQYNFSTVSASQEIEVQSFPVNQVTEGIGSVVSTSDIPSTNTALDIGIACMVGLILLTGLFIFKTRQKPGYVQL